MSYQSGPLRSIYLSVPYPGKILRMPLQNSAILCQRDSFLCADGNIAINVEFTKRLGVKHESPQVIVVRDGRPVYLADVAAVNDGLQEPADYVFFGSHDGEPVPNPEEVPAEP